MIPKNEEINQQHSIQTNLAYIKNITKLKKKIRWNTTKLSGVKYPKSGGTQTMSHSVINMNNH